MNSYLAVAIGGAIGALLRFAISEWVGGFQATLLVNAIGSLILGMCMAGLTANLMAEDLTIFLGTGILGAFTTMSTFSVETIELWNDNHTTAIGYVALTMLLCPILAYAGWRTVEIIA